jgi:hypothetical protein
MTEHEREMNAVVETAIQILELRRAQLVCSGETKKESVRRLLEAATEVIRAGSQILSEEPSQTALMNPFAEGWARGFLTTRAEKPQAPEID